MTDDRGPEELQDRIDRLRKSQERGGDQKSLAMGLVFFMSMGVSMAGAVYGGYLVGSWLDHRTGAAFYLPICLLLGVAGGAMIVWQLLKPMLK